MKYFTLDIPGETPGIIALSPHFGHDRIAKAIIQAIPGAQIVGGAFLTLPPEVMPRCVGESLSLKLGPTHLDQELVVAAFKSTARTYPYSPLFDNLLPVDPAKR